MLLLEAGEVVRNSSGMRAQRGGWSWRKLMEENEGKFVEGDGDGGCKEEKL